jgi:hypothetical protein
MIYSVENLQAKTGWEYVVVDKECDIELKHSSDKAPG